MTAQRAQPGGSENADEVLLLFQRIVRGLKHADVPSEFETALKEVGLADRHLAALVMLSIVGPVTVTDFAQELGIARASASLLLTELNRKGFVARDEDERDLRRTIVSVAPDRAEAVDDYRRRRAEFVQRGLADASGEERATLVKLLASIADAIRTP